MDLGGGCRWKSYIGAARERVSITKVSNSEELTGASKFELWDITRVDEK